MGLLLPYCCPCANFDSSRTKYTYYRQNRPHTDASYIVHDPFRELLLSEWLFRIDYIKANSDQNDHLEHYVIHILFGIFK